MTMHEGEGEGSSQRLPRVPTVEAVLPRQRLHWQQGERISVEFLLEQFPHLRENREAVLDLINHEIILCAEFEGPPNQQDYVRRFPEYQDDLAILFEVHDAIEQQGEKTGAWIKPNTQPSTWPSPRPSQLPVSLPVLPNFTVEAILGEGGMGVVYKATDHRLKRTVALKMIRAGGGQEHRKRFQSEAEAVAKLDHPHIVHIFDMGDHDQQPYFALEFVDGGTLSGLLKSEPQPPALAAQMVETLARAVHYAHGQGIIHRDLKPANILLQKVQTPAGASSTAMAGLVVKDGAAYLPKIADFGLAKHIQPDSLASQTQAIVGTPSYMSPEQAGDFKQKIGPAADVYALGAILYEMITGRPPFRGSSALDTLDQVRKMDPVPPCRLQPHCPRDLETICMMCLKKDPARFTSAAELADDLGRFLRHEPIRARPASTFEHVRLWCRRNPRVAVLSASLLTVILGSLAAVTIYWQRAAKGEASAYAQLYVSQINLGQRHWQDAQCRRLARLLDILRQPPAGQSDLRGFEWYYLNALLHQDLATMPGDNCVAFSPDGKLLATAGPGNRLCLWATDHPNTRKLVHEWPAHSQITSVAFSPKGDGVLSGSMDGIVRLWRVSDGSLLKALEGHSGAITSVAFDSAEASMATASRDGSIRLWEADGTVRLSLDDHKLPVNQIAFSPDGKLLASAGDDNFVRLWEVATGDVVHVLQGSKYPVVTVAFAPDGRSIVTGGQDKTLRQWNVDSGEERRSLPPLEHVIHRAVFRPDGKRLAATCIDDQTIHVWEIDSPGKDLQANTARVLRGHFDWVVDLAFHPTQPWLASVARDHTVRIVDPDRDPEVRTVNLENDNTAAAFALHPNQLLAAVGTYTGAICLCDLNTGGCRTLPAHQSQVSALAFSADGLWLASAGEDGSLRVWQMPGGALERDLATLPAAATALAFDPKTKALASGCEDGSICFHDCKTGKETGRASPHEGKVFGLAFSDDGRWLASAGKDKALRIWNVARQKAEQTVSDIGKKISGYGFRPDGNLAFSPDGSRVAIGANLVVGLWDWRRAELVQALEGHTGSVHYVAFTHDGKRLVSAAQDKNLKLWDLTTGQELLTLKWHDRMMIGVTFDRMIGVTFDSTDQCLVAVGNGPLHGQIRVWDARPGRKVP